MPRKARWTVADVERRVDHIVRVMENAGLAKPIREALGVDAFAWLRCLMEDHPRSADDINRARSKVALALLDVRAEAEVDPQ